jgi:hypothetical protein
LAHRRAYIADEDEVAAYSPTTTRRTRGSEVIDGVLITVGLARFGYST